MTIEIKHKKPYGICYDCYVNNNIVKKNSEISIPDEGEIVLVERSIFLSKLWWLLIIFNLLCGLLASFDDWKDERTKQKKITVGYSKIISDKIVVEVSDEGRTINLEGVESFSIGDITEEENVQIKKRKFIARKSLIIFPIAALILLAIILVICLL